MTISFSYLDVSSHPSFDNHETVLKAEDSDIGFKAFIAVHDSTMGPARGGCRYWSRYQNESEAIKDVLKLSKGMTYKTALAHLEYGGGKTVIVGPEGTTNPAPEIMIALGHALNELKGIYETGEDVGTRTEDFKIAGTVTDYVRVKSVENAGAQDLPGGPPLYTAHGVLSGIKAAVKHQFKKDDLKDVSIAVKGLGNVASPLCEFLYQQGAVLTVADIDPAKVEYAKKNWNAKTVSPDEIMFQDVDVYTPCALGGDINMETFGKIKARVVAGAANNQLADVSMADALHNNGILYAPDYGINAGGVINVVLVGASHEEVLMRVQAIGNTLAEIFERSEAQNLNTMVVADMIVQERLQKKRQSFQTAIAV